MSEEQIEAREKMRQVLENMNDLVGTEFDSYDNLFRDMLPQFPSKLGKLIDDLLKEEEEEELKNKLTENVYYSSDIPIPEEDLESIIPGSTYNKAKHPT